jgi:hypothetical protein
MTDGQFDVVPCPGCKEPGELLDTKVDTGYGYAIYTCNNCPVITFGDGPNAI